MANPFATGWMQLFIHRRMPSPFLQSFFTMKPGNAYNGKTIELDIQRFGEDVAVAMKAGTESNINQMDLVTTKEFTPPAYGEAVPVDVNDLLARTAGVDPYTDAYNGFAAKLINKLNTAFQVIRDMITRAVEQQASQILQTGKLTLKNRGGDEVYVIDFKPKATHFPTVTT